MINFDRLEEQVHNALTHLHDPDYQPPSLLCRVLGCPPTEGAVPLQSMLFEALEALEPDIALSSDAHNRRVYDVLHFRYVLDLTQEETAERLNVSVRHLNRIQRKAVHTLTRSLWDSCVEKQNFGEASTSPPTDRTIPPSELDWNAQAKRELASVQENNPDAVSEVTPTIDHVLKLVQVIASERQVDVAAEFVQSNLTAAVHPSVLRQMLVATLERLIRYTSGGGRITVSARLENGNVKFTLTGARISREPPQEDELTSGILIPSEASVSAHIQNDFIFFWLELPTPGKTTTLVLDDNHDMARLYRRYTDGTAYHIIHITRGQTLFETIQEVDPDIIVLDVMLPDCDGWELLMRLRENRLTRDIPVVVCSVVKEKELALSLGATRCLSKPVRADEFIQALDQALAADSNEMRRTPG